MQVTNYCIVHCDGSETRTRRRTRNKSDGMGDDGGELRAPGRIGWWHGVEGGRGEGDEAMGDNNELGWMGASRAMNTDNTSNEADSVKRAEAGEAR